MSASAPLSELHVPVYPVRFITATALFDGHDAAINIMRRILQAQGAEGGHVEYFEYLAQLLKHDGTLPLVGVNTFRNPAGTVAAPAELARGTEEEKKSQLDRVHDFTERHRQEAHAALAALKETARSGGNVFAVLMEGARVCSLQQITEAFFEVGGQYRRNI